MLGHAHPAPLRDVPDFRRAFVYTPGDNEWTDCHRFSNGSHNPLDRLAFVREVFFPQIGQTTGGQIRPVASQAEGAEFSEFVENVMFIKQDVMFATLHSSAATTVLRLGTHNRTPSIPATLVRCPGSTGSRSSTGAKRPPSPGWSRSSMRRTARAPSSS